MLYLMSCPEKKKSFLELSSSMMNVILVEMRWGEHESGQKREHEEKMKNGSEEWEKGDNTWIVQNKKRNQFSLSFSQFSHRLQPERKECTSFHSILLMVYVVMSWCRVERKEENKKIWNVWWWLTSLFLCVDSLVTGWSLLLLLNSWLDDSWDLNQFLLSEERKGATAGSSCLLLLSFQFSRVWWSGATGAYLSFLQYRKRQDASHIIIFVSCCFSHFSSSDHKYSWRRLSISRESCLCILFQDLSTLFLSLICINWFKQPIIIFENVFCAPF